MDIFIYFKSTLYTWLSQNRCNIEVNEFKDFYNITFFKDRYFLGIMLLYLLWLPISTDFENFSITDTNINTETE